MTAIADLAGRLASLNSPDALPDTVFETARQRLFDSLACFWFGAAREEGRLLQRVFASATIDDEIRYVTGATRCTELDDIHIESCTTPGSVIAPLAVLGARSHEVEDRRVLSALVAGYQAMADLGRAVNGAHIVYDGIWPTYFAAPFGAAAVGAQLLRLDEHQTAHALAIAATRCVGTTGQMPSVGTSRWFTVGCAASDGYRAAIAASLGMLGDASVLERMVGRATGVNFDASLFQSSSWTILDVDVKPFRTGRQALSAVEAYATLGPAPAAERIDIWLPRQVLGMLDRPHPPGAGLRLGLQFQIAALTCADPAARDAFMARVHLAADDRLSALYPRQWGARVEITGSGGSATSLEVLDPKGSARRPFGWTELLEKHRQAGAAPPGKLEQLYELCRAFGVDRARHPSSPGLLRTLGLA